MSLSPEQRSQRATIAALTRWSKEDPKPAAANARVGWRKKFEDVVDPDRVLPQAERDVRVRRAITAHMKSLALKSARARSKDGA
jgi:hypothetical protein